MFFMNFAMVLDHKESSITSIWYEKLNDQRTRKEDKNSTQFVESFIIVERTNQRWLKKTLVNILLQCLVHNCNKWSKLHIFFEISLQGSKPIF
jgi:hypothetical protein